MEGYLTAPSLSLVIQENNVELLRNGKAGATVVKSVAIYKGDVHSALQELSAFIHKNRSLNHYVDFIIPADQIKVYRKIIRSENIDKDDMNGFIRKILEEEFKIDVSQVFFDFFNSKDLIEIAIVDRQKLVEAISFIESTNFKVLSALGILKDQREAFVFSSKNDFKKTNKIKQYFYFKDWFLGKASIHFLKSKLFNSGKLINLNLNRNFAFLSFVILSSIVLSATYYGFFLESKKGEILQLQNTDPVLSVENKIKLEHTVSGPLNIFVPSEISSLSYKQTVPQHQLAGLSSKNVPRDISINRIETFLPRKTDFHDKINFNFTDISSINIDAHWKHLNSLEEQFLLSENPIKKSLFSIQDSSTKYDTSVKFTKMSPLFNYASKNSVPELNLDTPVNKIRMQPKMRPNTYPFEVKIIPKKYVRPRLRPALIEELAEKSQIFSNSEIGFSINPKERPKIINRIAAADYSQEGEEASVTGVISKADTKKSIVKLATTKKAINKRKINVISIYSRGSERRAIVIFPTGQTKFVKVGDVLDGGRVAAIGASEIRYIKGGSNLVLRIPEG